MVFSRLRNPWGGRQRSNQSIFWPVMPHQMRVDPVALMIEPEWEHFYLTPSPYGRALKRCKSASDEKAGRPLKHKHARQDDAQPRKGISNKSVQSQEKTDDLKSRKSPTFYRPWVERVNAAGFDPADLEVKVQDRKVVIEGKHRVETDSGHRMYTMKHQVDIPENVALDSIRTFMDESDMLIIKGVAKHTRTDSSPHDVFWPFSRLMREVFGVEDNKDESNDAEDKIMTDTDIVDMTKDDEMEVDAEANNAKENEDHTDPTRNKDENDESITINSLENNQKSSTNDDTLASDNTQVGADVEMSDKAEADGSHANNIVEAVNDVHSKESETDKENEESSTEENVKSSEAVESPEKPPEPWAAELAVPGFEPTKLQVVVSGRVLSIRGEQTKEKEGVYEHRRISRSVTIPPHVDPQSLTSAFSHGKLVVTGNTDKTIEDSNQKLAIRYLD